MNDLLNDLPIVTMVIAAVLVGIWISNIVFDRGVPNYISRKIGHGAGGLAFLVAIVLSSAWWAIIVSSVFSVLLILGHEFAPNSIRGVGGSGREVHVFSEVWFPLVAIPVFSIAWLWLKQPGIAVGSLLYMAWGDGVTGLVRSQIYHRPVKGLWGSLAMLITCLIISWVLIHPFWIGAAASIIAVITEWAFGEQGVVKWADDNWAIPLASLLVLLGLKAITGSL